MEVGSATLEMGKMGLYSRQRHLQLKMISITNQKILMVSLTIAPFRSSNI